MMMEKIKKPYAKDHIYYQISIPHNNQDDEYLSTFAYTNVELTEPLLDKPEDYYVSIIRFSVPGQGIPLTIFPTDQFGQSLLSVSFLYTPLQQVFRAFVLYNPDTPLNSYEAKHHFLYSYQSLIDSINDALASLTTDINIEFPGILDFAPFFKYDAKTALISFVTPYDNIVDGVIDIYISTPLFTNYLNGFQTVEYKRGDFDGLDFRIVTEVYPGNTNGYAFPGTVLTDPPNALIFEQEYNTLQYWSAFKNIVFASSLLPIVSESIPGQGNDQNISGNANYFPIMTDFEPLLQAAGDARSQIQYFPQGPYRFVDMYTSTPLRRIDMTVYWQDKHNNLYPLTVAFGQTADIKLLFRRKIDD